MQLVAEVHKFKLRKSQRKSNDWSAVKWTSVNAYVVIVILFLRLLWLAAAPADQEGSYLATSFAISSFLFVTVPLVIIVKNEAIKKFAFAQMNQLKDKAATYLECIPHWSKRSRVEPIFIANFAQENNVA